MSTVEVDIQPPAAEPPVAAAETNALSDEKPAEQPAAVAATEKEEEKKPKRERKQRTTPKEKEIKLKPPAHPPYFQMIKEAITALNEKGGSSPYAIAKYMEEKHQSVLPANFRKILGLQLKNSVSKGKLIKIKASYKLTEARKMKEASTTAKTTRAARANAGSKPTKEVVKRRKPKSKSVSKIENSPPASNIPNIGATTRARRSKRAASAAKLKQLKSIKSPMAKKAKKSST